MTATQKLRRPVAGVDTPAADDIIDVCQGSHCRCAGWVVVQHPSHVRGGGAFDPESGELRYWKPTSEWVEAEAKRIEKSARARAGCGRPVVSEERAAEAERELDTVDKLRAFVTIVGGNAYWLEDDVLFTAPLNLDGTPDFGSFAEVDWSRGFDTDSERDEVRAIEESLR